MGKHGPSIQILSRKIHKVKRLIRAILQQRQRVAVRTLAKFTGQCVAMMKAVLPAPLLLRNIFRLIAQRSSWNDYTALDLPSVQDLEWWQTALQHWNRAPILRPHIDLQVTTDASQTGWGTAVTVQGSDLSALRFHPELLAAGTWTKDVAHQSSNFRELLTILRALQTFGHRWHGRCVQFLSDNVTTVAHLNKLLGATPLLLTLTKTIFACAAQHQITLCARHLAGVRNQVSDHLSRVLDKHEWQLHPRILHTLNQMWGPHHVDRFATMENTQLPVYNSRYLDPLTAGVDALAQQLAQPTVLSDGEDPPENTKGQVFSDDYRTDVEVTELVSHFCEVVHISTVSATPTAQRLHQNSRNPGTKEELGLADLRLEGVWRSRLISEGWSPSAADALVQTLPRLGGQRLSRPSRPQDEGSHTTLLVRHVTTLRHCTQVRTHLQKEHGTDPSRRPVGDLPSQSEE